MISGLLRRAGLDVLTRQYVPVGLSPGELAVGVTLERAGRTIDVSASCSVASLRPVRLAVSDEADAGGGPAVLRWWEGGRTLVGELTVAPEGTCGPEGRFRLYRPIAQRCVCLGSALTRLTEAHWKLDRWRRARRGDPDPFLVAGLDLWALLVFYIRPRPVVAVSVGEGASANVFPMDLTGTASDGHFVMALRSTSANVPTMERTRRIAMAEVPPDFKEHAYALAAYHKRARPPDQALPFATSPSPTWGLPLPAEALRVREVEVVRTDVVGSHHVFTTRIAHDHGSSGPRLHHVSQVYARALRLGGRPLRAA